MVMNAWRGRPVRVRTHTLRVHGQAWTRAATRFRFDPAGHIFLRLTEPGTEVGPVPLRAPWPSCTDIQASQAAGVEVHEASCSCANRMSAKRYERARSNEREPQLSGKAGTGAARHQNN